MASRSNLKKRILVQYQGGREVQPGGIHQYFEDLNRAPNAETCPPLEEWTNPPQADLRWLLEVAGGSYEPPQI